ncbi:MAG: TonB family protein [Bdellovibrionota bacterium]
MRRALLSSLVFHALTLAAFLLVPHAFLASKKSTTALATRVLSENEFLKETHPTDIRKAQIVQTDDQLKTTQAPLDHEEVFLGRHNQRVDKNTRAARVGEFKNVLKEGLRDARDLFKLAKDDSESAPITKKSTDRGPASVAEGSGKTTRFPANVAPHDPVAQGEGFSATDDYLPNVAIGANTLLNAREYKYASFFERIREKLNHQWQSRLRSEMEGLYIHGVHGFSGERVTKLRVILDSKGEVVRIDTEGSAGYLEFDRAAIGAFHAASPFPNPPKDLLEGSNATLSIDWHFVVQGSEDMGVRMRVDRVPAGFR